MSRALFLAAVCLPWLGGCIAPPTQPTPAPATPPPTLEVADYQALRDWLELQQAVAEMTPATVMSELARAGKPQSPQQWFYYGLLNQQLKSFASWARARDAFREVSQAEGLSAGRLQLASIFERYNQSRINWHQEYSQLAEEQLKLQEQLQLVQGKNAELEQKIQAITDLETTISTRKEQ